ncbi:DUF5908 family protein [Nannocystis sp.]|uniref:DUF5908 family protein n=1 Tax=Nannocystis sp. TaxID=1962667 RepID=UPI0025F2543D|nr:DUF5908 family protein [Nannocystis sp.]MBK7826416.1 hypothetical protein [Nannocystis sp.]
MTIEIRQLVIRAVAEARPAAAQARVSLPASTTGPEPAQPPAAATPAADHESLVAACVREVLRELRRSSER